MKTTNKEQTLKEPRKVFLSTYFQSLAIAILATAVITTIGTYFVSINVHDSARASVVNDLQLVKNTTAPSKQ